MIESLSRQSFGGIIIQLIVYECSYNTKYKRSLMRMKTLMNPSLINTITILPRVDFDVGSLRLLIHDSTLLRILNYVYKY